jgi:hypothetical protein
MALADKASAMHRMAIPFCQQGRIIAAALARAVGSRAG